MSKKLVALLSCFVMLSSGVNCSVNANAEHTFVFHDVDITMYEGCYTINFDNIIYATKEDYIAEEYIPNAGTFDFSRMVTGLLEAYPSVQLAVQIDTYAFEKTYTEETKQFGNAHTPEETTAYLLTLLDEEIVCEPERMKENGIQVTNVTNKYIYAVMTAEQLDNFPASDTLGYLITLATPSDMLINNNVDILDIETASAMIETTMNPEETSTAVKTTIEEISSVSPVKIEQVLSGDTNGDGEIGVVDAVLLQKWLLGIGELPDWRSADLCEDGVINIYDLLKLKQMLTQI